MDSSPKDLFGKCLIIGKILSKIFFGVFFGGLIGWAVGYRVGFIFQNYFPELNTPTIFSLFSMFAGAVIGLLIYCRRLDKNRNDYRFNSQKTFRRTP